MSVAEGSFLKVVTDVCPQKQKHREAGDGSGVGTKKWPGASRDFGSNTNSYLLQRLLINSDKIILNH